MRILLVEDDLHIAKALKAILSRNQFDMELAPDGKAGLHLALSGIFDLILLDIMLPKLTGLEILAKLRKTDKQTPVILLTARDGIEDKVRGLDLGADDYLPKPFNTDELLARVRCALRRNLPDDPPATLGFANLSLNLQSHQLSANTREVMLSESEFRLLCCLLRNETVVVGYDHLVEAVWTQGNGHVEALSKYVHFLRRKFVHLGVCADILEIRGIGYKLLERTSPLLAQAM